jgi:protein phosphatase
MGELENADTVEFPAVNDLFAKHFGPIPPPVGVTFGALSHPGLVRANNEDHYMVIQRRRARSVLLTNLPEGFLPPADDVAYVMAVADGVGGAAFGELASMLALRSGWDLAPGTIKWTWIITDREVEDFKERVGLIFQRINEALLRRAEEEPACAGMGTTLTAAYTVGPEAFVAHVGDSRAYLLRGGRLTQLTRDHTLAQESLDEGLPIISRSWYHILTNYLGGREQQVRVEFHHVRLTDGDRLMVCTDGLTDLVPDEDVAGLLVRHPLPQEAAQALVDRALARGGKDNVTVVLAHYEVKGTGAAPAGSV